MLKINIFNKERMARGYNNRRSCKSKKSVYFCNIVNINYHCTREE